MEPDCARLAGAIVGRALYDGRLDPRAALALVRPQRQARMRVDEVIRSAIYRAGCGSRPESR